MLSCVPLSDTNFYYLFRNRVIVVSSGGMLTVKLDLSDLQSEKLSPFDGTVVYSQNKRQQVIFTQKLAKRYESVFFASMHPGKNDLLRDAFLSFMSFRIAQDGPILRLFGHPCRTFMPKSRISLGTQLRVQILSSG